jgi:hypothetical protein
MIALIEWYISIVIASVFETLSVLGYLIPLVAVSVVLLFKIDRRCLFAKRDLIFAIIGGSLSTYLYIDEGMLWAFIVKVLALSFVFYAYSRYVRHIILLPETSSVRMKIAVRQGLAVLLLLCISIGIVRVLVSLTGTCPGYFTDIGQNSFTNTCDLYTDDGCEDTIPWYIKRGCDDPVQLQQLREQNPNASVLWPQDM